MTAEVSVVIPVWNGAETIARAIDSVLTQDFAGAVEIIVVDDGSTDATAEVLARYQNRIVILHQVNRGPAAARNAGVREAQGKYVAFLDADDEWLPEKLAQTVAILDRDSAVLVGSDALLIDRAGLDLKQRYVSPSHAHAPSLKELLIEPWNLLPSTWVVRREAFVRCGGFDERFVPGQLAFEDSYFLILFRELGEFAYLDQPLVRYRVADSFAARLQRRLGTFARLTSADLSRCVENHELFVRLVSQRYGAKASRLIGSIRQSEVNLLVGIGLTAMGADQRDVARAAYLYALRLPRDRFKTAARLMFALLPDHLARMVLKGLTARLAKSLTGPAQA